MKKIYLLIIPILFSLTGCYNYRELNDLAIVSGISISMTDNQYEVMVEVVNPKKQQDATGSDEPDFIIYKKKANSMQQAFREIVEESPKKLYTAHLNILIIDESVAKKNLKDILDFFAREPEIRNEFYVLIGKNNNILSITTPLENISSKNILDSLKTNNKYLGYANLITFHDIISNYLNPYTELAISSIKMTGNEEKGDTIKNLEDTERNAASIISGIAIFKNNQLVGYLENEDALVYNIVLGNTNTFLIKSNLNNQHYIVNEIFREKTKININIENKTITIKVSGSASLVEETAPINLEKVNTIHQLQDTLNNTIEELINNSISNTINKYHTDIYGFQEEFYHHNPNNIKKLDKDWEKDILPTLTIKVKSNIKIIEKGNLNGGLYHE